MLDRVDKLLDVLDQQIRCWLAMVACLEAMLWPHIAGLHTSSNTG